MIRVLISAVLLLVGCRGENQHSASDKTGAPHEVLGETNKGKNEVGNSIWTNSDSCEVVKIDSFSSGRLQGIFIVIKSQLVFDTSFIKQTICKLKTSYPLDGKSSISFFSEKKYAGYKDDLFFNAQRSLPESEYPKWLENYYLGEFNSETSAYVTYPASYKVGKRKVFNITVCP